MTAAEKGANVKVKAGDNSASASNLLNLCDVFEVEVWDEPGVAVMIRAVSGGGDPVELTAAEARSVANVLLRLAEQLDRDDHS